MNVIQKLVLLIGCGVLLSRALFPPWHGVDGERSIDLLFYQWASECLKIVAVMGILLAIIGLIASLIREPKDKTSNK